MKWALDFDGTLVTCREKQMACLLHLLNRFECKANLGIVWNLKRAGATTQEALEKNGIEYSMAEKISRIWQINIEEPFWSIFDRPILGVQNALQKLTDMYSKPLLVTARNRAEWVKPKLQALGMIEMFDHICVVPTKEASRWKAEFLFEQHVDIYIGDSESDLKAAQDAEIEFIAVSTGQRSEEFLASCGAIRILRNLDELFQKKNCLQSD
jgi:phosphoglycolate phosphatase-like HAD superfamily hydrolase